MGAASQRLFRIGSGILRYWILHLANSKSARKTGTETADESAATHTLIDSLARSAMSRLASTARPTRAGDVESATIFLTRAVLDKQHYDQSEVLARLHDMHFDSERIIEECIPRTAEALGIGWSNDELSFTQVSAAASRLFGLCKEVGYEWENEMSSEQNLTILLVSFRREDHILGPVVLAHQLRRRGHSVRMMSNTDADDVAEQLAGGAFDCVMASAASLVALESTADELHALRHDKRMGLPIIVGGKALDYAAVTPGDVHADIVTSDLDEALGMLDDLRGARDAQVSP